MQRLRVGYLSAKNYFLETTFSGTMLSMYRALSRPGVEIVPLGWPVRPGLRRKFTRRLGWERGVSIASPSFARDSRRFASRVKRQLRRRPCDVFFAPIASSELLGLETDLPIVYASDATMKLLVETYGYEMSADVRRMNERVERSAIERARLLVYSSHWAADSAMADYGAKPDKIRIVDYGANIDRVPTRAEAERGQRTGCCRLLFVGKDWQRKGGAIAVDTLRALLAQGVDAELVMLGCTPPEPISQQRLTVIPFLDKKDPVQRRRVNDLYLQSHFLLFPTRADCSPIVVCEANAFGLPVVTSDVGGLPSLIRNGRNGRMLSSSAGAKEFARVIAEDFADAERYRALSRTARAEYDERLNWDAWGEKVEAILREAAEPS